TYRRLANARPLHGVGAWLHEIAGPIEHHLAIGTKLRHLRNLLLLMDALRMCASAVASVDHVAFDGHSNPALFERTADGRDDLVQARIGLLKLAETALHGAKFGL